MRRKLILTLTGLAAVLAIGIFSLTWFHAAGAADKAPEKLLYCGACHTMETEVLTWQVNAHKNVACLECHSEGDPGWVRHEFVDKNADMAAAGQVHPLELKVLTQRCEDCHQPQMDDLRKDITPRPLLASSRAPDAGKAMDVKALHNEHLKGDAKVQCVDCHVSDAHGAAVGSTPWRDATHKLCLDCHEQKQVKIAVTGPTSCSACHTDARAVAPSDHKDQASWKQAHGDSAGNNTCGECHLADSAGPHTQIANPTSFPSPTKDACAACHAGVPMPHPDNFLSTHGKVSQASKPGTCESCHAASATSPAAPGGAPSCERCHAQPMPHPATFLASHGAEAKRAPATCEACHSPKNQARPTAAHASASYCSQCHDSYQHPTGWVAAHGTAVTDSCATCHTLMGQQGQHNACSTCHTKDGQWHPDLWFAGHANVVNQQGDAACKTCHSEVEPSCSKCHRDR